MYSWSGIDKIESTPYICPFCKKEVASQYGYYFRIDSHHFDFNRKIVICPHCNNPTYFNYSDRYPGETHGPDVKKLSVVVQNAYNEARVCFSNNSFTACAMMCRKIIMNVSVGEGAKEGESFISYIDFIKNNNLIGKKSNYRLDKIRQSGNDANHQIREISKEEARELLDITSFLLITLFEHAEEPKVGI